jgi:hypothetical protein
MPLIHPPHDPRRFDARLFKGGDGGAGQMRADEQERQRKVQQAVDAINAKFGIGPQGGAAAAAPTRDAFTTRGITGGYQGEGTGQDFVSYYTTPTGETFDQAGFDAATAQWQAGQTDASGAKAAREAMYADIEGAVKDTAMRDLDRQYTRAARSNKFGLARAGLLGGSVDAEAGGELETLYGEGKLKAAGAGQSAASELRSADEKTRQNLTSLAQSGLDVGTAASMAAGQMGAAADIAKANANAATVGDLFSNMGQAYLMNQQLKARGAVQAQQPTSYGSGSRWGKNYSGRVTA